MRSAASIAGFFATTTIASLLFAARATPPNGAGVVVSGRAIRPFGAAITTAGLGRLVPALEQRIRRGPDWTASTRQQVIGALGSGADPGIAAAYGELPFFVAADGLNAAGRALVELVSQEARFYAVDVALPEAVVALADRAPEPREALEALDVGAVAVAWSEAGQRAAGGERIDATAALLAARRPAAKAGAVPLATRVEAEARLLEALAKLVARLPAAPRRAPMLVDEEHGFYLSPDVLWRDAPASQVEAEALQAALAAVRAGELRAHLEGLAPSHAQFRRLVAAARRYDGYCREGPWPALKAPRSEREARSPAMVAALQRRLAREGFLAPPLSGAWDDATEQAVLEARRVRHLKTRSAAFDDALVEALAVPCEERLRTLLLNVRRWRHTAWRGETESVQVNLAGQVLRYFRDGELVMTQRTIVGSDKSYFNKLMNRRHWRNATPILSDVIEQVIVNPEWNVPGRIAREEIAPAIEEDPDYLAKHNFRTVVGGDGATYFIQQAGPGNALGRIKVLFPNSESVYLHDTAARNLFKLPVRALSHGCVRVDNAVDFGAELVAADRAKDGNAREDADLVKRLARFSTKTRVFNLAHAVPVFLEYYTASVDEAGAVWFHPDIYGYDAETLDPQLAHEP